MNEIKTVHLEQSLTRRKCHVPDQAAQVKSNCGKFPQIYQLSRPMLLQHYYIVDFVLKSKKMRKILIFS